jgi:hypothetical protein
MEKGLGGVSVGLRLAQPRFALLSPVWSLVDLNVETKSKESSCIKV